MIDRDDSAGENQFNGVLLCIPSELDTLDARKKHAVLCYPAAYGNVAKVCRAIGISRQTWYNWIESDKTFAELIDEQHQAMLDQSEENVLRIANNPKHNGELTANIFLLNTQRSERFARQSHQVVEVEHRIYPDPIDLSDYAIDITEDIEKE